MNARWWPVAVGLIGLLSGCMPKSDGSVLGSAASMAASCSGCHAAQTGTAVISLKGLTEQQLVERLLAMRAEAAPATAMHRLARGYSESELRAIARSLARTQ